MIKAVIFDFDGVIIDTERSVFQAWQEIYEAHQAYLPIEKWIVCIGGAAELFDVYGYLEELLGRPVAREHLTDQLRRRHLELVAELQILPGVVEYLDEAKRQGLKIGMASSSTRAWVTGHLSRLGLLAYFDYIKCGDEVQHKKPDPELYLAVLDGLGVSATEAIVLEDSANGVLAANRAGIFSVAIPNVITGQFSLDHADMQLPSMAHLPLTTLITEVEKRQSLGHKENKGV